MIKRYEIYTEEQLGAIKDKGPEKYKAFVTAYSAYEKGKQFGAKIPVFADMMTVWTRDVDALVAELKEAGITEFIYALDYSNFQPVLWRFQELGFRIDGMVNLERKIHRYGEIAMELVPGLRLVKAK